jgi:hypothetical protein
LRIESGELSELRVERGEILELRVERGELRVIFEWRDLSKIKIPFLVNSSLVNSST